MSIQEQQSSVLKRLSGRLRSTFARKAKPSAFPNSGNLIEVYDVLFKTRHKRLQLFHLRSGQDLLTLPEHSDYLERTERMFTSQGEEDSSSVYILDADKSIYDVRDP